METPLPKRAWYDFGFGLARCGKCGTLPIWNRGCEGCGVRLCSPCFQCHTCINLGVVAAGRAEISPQSGSGHTTIRIVVGLNGHEITMQVEANMSFKDVLERIHVISGGPADGSVRLSVLGVVINSVEELLGAESSTVHATFIKSVDHMSLAEVADELACDDDEFKGHQFTLLKLPTGSTARAVADYFWVNQVLLTSRQAEVLFDKLLPKLGRGKGRSELIIALHSFCVQQHHVWEPDDGMSECMWANMTWDGNHVQFQNRRLTRGRLGSWECAEAVPDSRPDNWPANDLCCLRGVAKARRGNHTTPLDSMVFFKQYGNCWRKLQ